MSAMSLPKDQKDIIDQKEEKIASEVKKIAMQVKLMADIVLSHLLMCHTL